MLQTKVREVIFGEIKVSNAAHLQECIDEWLTTSSRACPEDGLPVFADPAEEEQNAGDGGLPLTEEEQVSAYGEMQDYLAEELPYLYLWYPDIISVKNTRLQGFPEINASTAFQFAEQWYVAP